MRAIWIVLVIASILVLGSLGLSQESYSQLSPGDLLVVDPSAGTDSRGLLFRVNPETGNREIITDFGNLAQGPLGDFPLGVIFDSTSGNIFVVDAGGGTDFRGVLFRVNPETGNREIITDFGNLAQGPLGGFPIDLVMDTSGNILVINNFAGTGTRGLLVSVNPATGIRTAISDFGNEDQGPLGNSPFGVIIHPTFGILVTDVATGTDFRGVLFSVDSTTGNRAIISDFGNLAQGPLGESPSGMTLGSLFVADPGGGTDELGELFHLNLQTGDRDSTTDLGNAAQGPLGIDPIDPVVDLDGNIFLIDPTARILFKVNPETGNREINSDFRNADQGELGDSPQGLFSVPSEVPPPPDEDFELIFESTLLDGIASGNTISYIRTTPNEIVRAHVAVTDATEDCDGNDANRPINIEILAGVVGGLLAVFDLENTGIGNVTQCVFHRTIIPGEDGIPATVTDIVVHNVGNSALTGINTISVSAEVSFIDDNDANG